MKLSDILDRSSKATTRPAASLLGIDDTDPWGRTAVQWRTEEPSRKPSQAGKAGSPSGVESSAQSSSAASPPPRPLSPPQSLTLPPPLRHLPPAWEMEIQRIAHHLAFGVRHAPQAVLFAAPLPSSGVSTLSYLLSHHLASSAPQQRTLFLRYLPHLQTGEVPALPVGAPFSWQQLPADQALNTLTLFGGNEYSVAEKVRWFRALIASARRLFVTILIDVPPFNRCAESYLLASESDGVVLVLKSGEVRKPAVAALRSELHRMGIQVLGGILTFRRYPLPQWLIRLL